MIRYILMDIEGTTTSIDFVHKILFPYASANLPSFIHQNYSEKAVQEQLLSVQSTILEENKFTPDWQECIPILQQWIKADRKHPALKNLQGMLWKSGYENGQYKGHLYPDVLPAWQQWTQAGLALGIYSSGSVEAQKLLFGFSEYGDVTPYLSHYFDTRVGHKREPDSYSVIQETLGLEPSSILFLSDVQEELDAAKQEGFDTIQVLRPGVVETQRHVKVNDFGLLEVK